MNSIMRNFVVPACVVALGAAAIFWNVERKRATERKFAEELQQYQSGANRGDANAEYELGQRYARGRGVTPDYAQARYWDQQAADRGLAKAKYAIGNLYYYGNGLTQSYADALVWYHKAADQGDTYAQNAIGSMYYYGEGVPQSYSEALTWYRRSADQGHPTAEYDVGLLYSQGLGVARDRNEANRWYRKAASQGDENAQLALGLRLPPCGEVGKFAPFIGLFGSSFILIGSFGRGSNLREPRIRKSAMLGLILLFWSAMDWFQNSKYGLFPAAWAADSFKIATLFLGGIMATLLVVFNACWPKAGKSVLIFSGLLFVAMDLTLFAIARFNWRAFSASAVFLRLTALDSFPLGMAISAALHLWRKKQEPADGAFEPPVGTDEAPHAV